MSCERIVTLAVCKRFIVEFSQILKKNVNENILFYVFGCVKSIHLRLSLGLLCIFVIAIPVKKITLCNTKKYKNQAGMNLTPPSSSQNSHAVRWHCIAESERRVAEIKS